jgi:hypothetical protein
MPESSGRAKTPKPAVRHETVASWAATGAAIVAAIGLIFTGCSVRYQGKQTKLQAEATKRQADDEDQRQARLVNVWPSATFSSQGAFVTVSNRSEEPVYRFRLYIAYAATPVSRHLVIRTWDGLQPCTSVTFDLQAIARSYKETATVPQPHQPFIKAGPEKAEGCQTSAP